MARYDAFLLRIWRSGDASEERQWAIRLEHLPDGQGVRLRDLEALLAYLRGVLHPEVPPVVRQEPEHLSTDTGQQSNRS